jgi:arginyl-tRNA synthetase
VVTDDESLTRARLFAVRAVRQVLEIALMLIGVSAPEKM